MRVLNLVYLGVEARSSSKFASRPLDSIFKLLNRSEHVLVVNRLNGFTSYSFNTQASPYLSE